MKPPWEWREPRAIWSALLVGLAGGIALAFALHRIGTP